MGVTMSVLRRLYHILRSEMRQVWGDPVQDADTSARAEGFEDEEVSGRGDANPRPPPNPDPLADCYASLEIEPGSDLETARRAWKQQLRKYHPDLFGQDPEKQSIAHEVTQTLNHAFEQIERHFTRQAKRRG